MNRANKARAKVERHALHLILLERNRSGANGTHADKRSRRLKTRQAQNRQALKDWA